MILNFGFKLFALYVYIYRSVQASSTYALHCNINNLIDNNILTSCIQIENMRYVVLKI